VDPAEMLKPKSTHCTVTSLQSGGGNKPWGVNLTQDDPVIPRDTFGADLVVVAAGYWSQELVPWVDLGLTGRAGSAWLYQGLQQNGFIIPWAPYKQIVGFDRGDGYWVSDGSAIKPENWTEQRKSASFLRCSLDPDQVLGKPKELTGIRPYTKESPCLCKEVSPGLWVATGARKNGTLLGAWCAQKIVKEAT
jgi:glycine/D-amino acid oxidase-like deaminating enzyme